MRALALRFALVVTAAGCSRSYVNVAYKAEVDRVLTTRTTPDRHIPAPDTLRPKFWKVGQWAFYKRSGGEWDTGYEKISVVAEDSCGIWIKDETHGYSDQHTWLLCVRPMPNDASLEVPDLLQVAIWQANGESPYIVDFRDGEHANDRSAMRSFVSELSPSRSPGDADLPREDVDVPAGHFAQTTRRTEKLDASLSVTRWTHPDVPLGGTVKRRTSGGIETVLMGYGDGGAPSVIPELEIQLAWALEPRPRPRAFMSLGFGPSWFSGTARETSSRANGGSGHLGVRVTPKLDIIAEVAGIDGATYSPDATLSQSTFLGLLGMRWSPYREVVYRRPDGLPGVSALYVEADVGYAELDRTSSTGLQVAARGFAAGAAIGWIGVQMHDWVAGFELSDHLAIYNSGEGTRHSIAFTVFYQLYLPFMP